MTKYVCMQGEPSECGLACLVMLARKSGIFVTLEELRQKHRPNNYGVSLKQLKELASDIGLNVKMVTFDELEDFSEVNGVGILHMAMGHYIVLDKVNQLYCSILNPSMGSQILRNETLKSSLSGYALVLDNESTERHVTATKLHDTKNKIMDFGKINPYLVALGIVMVLFSSIIPAYILGSPEAMLENGSMDILYFVLLFALQFFALLLSYLCIRKEISIQNFHFMNNGRVLFSKLLSNTMDFFERRHVSDVSSKIMSYLGAKVTESTIYNKTFISIFKLIVGFSVLVFVSPILTSIVALAALLRT
ncbi:cysteine peptidase family C39 domain-containing protein, partial [Photobacterium minamisatsumaniensis]|uniref:cysteine peptidase family C39 domain-containing protein n=1 Tax=Photobacterium minamisatsumaniensis TaxID=2910233 RepID=UPI003D0D2957